RDQSFPVDVGRYGPQAALYSGQQFACRTHGACRAGQRRRRPQSVGWSAAAAGTGRATGAVRAASTTIAIETEQGPVLRPFAFGVTRNTNWPRRDMSTSAQQAAAAGAFWHIVHSMLVDMARPRLALSSNRLAPAKG